MLLLIHLIVVILPLQFGHIKKSICKITLFSVNYYFNNKCESPTPLT
jgi:hypothetical protein